jgi:hypothetical protein
MPAPTGLREAGLTIPSPVFELVPLLTRRAGCLETVRHGTALTGEIPERKDPSAVDQRLIEQYGLDMGKNCAGPAQGGPPAQQMAFAVGTGNR